MAKGGGNSTLAPHSRPGALCAQGSEWWIQKENQQRGKVGVTRVVVVKGYGSKR